MERIIAISSTILAVQKIDSREFHFLSTFFFNSNGEGKYCVIIELGSLDFVAWVYLPFQQLGFRVKGVYMRYSSTYGRKSHFWLRGKMGLARLGFGQLNLKRKETKPVELLLSICLRFIVLIILGR